jgi:hypothetical protein
MANAGREYTVNAGSTPASLWKQRESLADFVAIIFFGVNAGKTTFQRAKWRVITPAVAVTVLNCLSHLVTP